MCVLPPDVTIRRLPEHPTEEDYQALSQVSRAANPENARTARELREQDEPRDARYFLGRFLAEQEGQPVGMAGGGHSSWNDAHRKFWVSITVVPTARRQGIGGQLYEQIQNAIARFDPLKIVCDTREDRPESIRFATRRGFVEQMRAFESRLDAAAFEPGLFAARRGVPARHGIEIASLKDLQESVPDWCRRLYELERATSEDIPRTDVFTFAAFEQFERLLLSSSSFLPEGYAIARDSVTGSWVGLSSLWKRDADSWLHTGMTGVRREYRRKGIAFALKLKAIDYARSVGCPVITTGNATNNCPMLSLNEALGFVKQPAWIQCARIFGEAGANS